MGFWPFGRDPASIEIVSRVITAATQNGFRVRGKLTIHFVEPQHQADADLAADRCASLAMALLREAPDHGRVIGAEIQLSADLTARYPGDVARARAVELAALHVLGDPTLSDELRRASGTMAAVSASHLSTPLPEVTGETPKPPTSAPQVVAKAEPSTDGAHTPRPASPTSPTSGRAAPSTSRPPAARQSSAPPPAMMPGFAEAPRSLGTPNSAAPPMRRRGSSQIRSIRSLLMPPGTSPAAMGQFVAPTVKDSAARLLIGYLRAHDLITVRRASIDEGSAEMLATLVPASDAPPGGYEASRAGEIARWQAILGAEAMNSLHHEVRVRCIYLARAALARSEVMAALASAVLESVGSAAFPEDAGLLAESAVFATPVPDDFVADMAEALALLAAADDDPASMAAALAPLVATVQEDMMLAALIIKQSSGG